jgi:hypothetical protein
MRIPIRYFLTNFDPHRDGGGVIYRGDVRESDRRGLARVDLFIRTITTQTGSIIWVRINNLLYISLSLIFPSEFIIYILITYVTILIILLRL